MARADFRLRITKVYPAGDLMDQITPKMRNLGAAIGRRMQRLVPKRTWALHNSVFHTTDATGTQVITTVGFGGGDVNYGLMVEKGTSRMRAQPFARPALLQSSGRDFRFSGDLSQHAIVEQISQREKRRRRAAAARSLRKGGNS